LIYQAINVKFQSVWLINHVGLRCSSWTSHCFQLRGSNLFSCCH